MIGTLDCAGATNTGTLAIGVAASSVSTSIPYSGGNGFSHDGETVLSTGVTGLTATLAAASFASGSGSLTYVITGTPSATGIASFASNIGGQSCTFNIPVGCGAYVASGQWKQFTCHNLGANTSVDPLTPSWELNGNYYQWGRNPTCFGRDGIDAPNACSSPVYGAAGLWGNTTANDNAGAITGWSTTVAPDGAWANGSKTANDPCPAGWRVATATQLTNLASNTLNPRTSVGTWTLSTTNYGAGFRFGESLFLPVVGVRGFSSGGLFSRGTEVVYWSSTESGGNAQAMQIRNTGPFLTVNNRSLGNSLRCVAE